MIPSNFKYYRAGSVDEALELLTQHGPDAKLLAGGHSLLPAMKLRFNTPGSLIDIAGIKELNYIKEDGDQVVIGAGTTHGQLATSDLISEKLPMVMETAMVVGDTQVRNRGTIGGSIAHADPAADWPASLLAADAEVVIRNVSGIRKVNASDFFKGLFTTALDDGDIITEIRIPVSNSSNSTYLKFEHPASRFAILGCAAVVIKDNGNFEQVRLAFTGISSTPFRDHKVEEMLQGKQLSKDTIAEAAEKAASDADMMSDHFASGDYRRHLATVYARRALEAVAL